MRRFFFLFAGLGLVGCSATPLADHGGTMPAREPGSSLRLIVQITVDQLRADLPLRMRDKWGPGGFARFFESGVVYEHAHYAHAITETSVGHATLFTGALPKEHGIVGNEWYDLATHERVYAVDDASSALVGSEGGGKSPRHLLVPTLGDALIAATGGKALVRAVSAKDRGAILPGGARGLAFWLDDKAGSFVTSRYYLEALPGWLSGLDVSPYRELPLPQTPKGDSVADFTAAFRRSSYVDDLLGKLVARILENEPLGADEVPDLLSVSFSATDYIGHAFGPESPEATANLLALDRTLAALLSLLDARVGSEHLLVVLSADHGGPESPEWFLKRGEDAGRIDGGSLVATLNRALRDKLRVDADLVLDFVNPNLWLDEGAIKARSLGLLAVERALVEVVRAQPGFFGAYAREDVLAGKVVADELERRVTASVHPTRSGHVYVVPKPHWLLATETKNLVAMHGTPHEYDTHVPIYVLGSRARPGRIDRPVDPRDIAPTLAHLLHIPPPSGSSGQRLREVTGD